MKTAGIICECNPFHSGHKYLIECAKASGADAVVCVMSGYFTQRGEAALLDPYSRAVSVMQGGADLVLELPYPYSASGAEFFADAGVNILSRLGVDELWFGSECGDLDRLTEAADAVMREDFSKRYTESGAGSVGTAKAFFDLLQSVCGGEAAFLSNDILGISYLCAIKRQNATMRPVTVTRRGSAYLDEALHEGMHPSATAIRRAILSDRMQDACDFLLPETAEALRLAEQDGLAPADLQNAERAVLAHLRLCAAEDLQTVAELEGGLGNRLFDAARQATTLDELISLASTKKYPNARLRRGVLFAMTGVKKEDLRAEPAYVRVLAANAAGRAFMAGNRKEPSLPLVTRQAEIPDGCKADRQELLHTRAVSLYTLCLKQSKDMTALMRKNPTILK